jgi:uncharacterized protein with von Willebrand factor type A (vWA) domain
MTDDYAFFGTLFALVCCVGGVVARDRTILRLISEGDSKVQAATEKKMDVLHERVNKTRDEFVRRDDLDGHLSRIEKSIGIMHEEQRDMNKRLNEFIAVTVVHDKLGR